MATTVAVLGVVGSLASAGASYYAADQQADAAAAGRDAMMSRAGLLGPAGLWMGSDNLALLKENYNDILGSEGFFFGDSPEWAQRAMFAPGLSGDEKQLISQGTQAAFNPDAIAGEGEALNYLRQVLRGEFLPGQDAQNPQMNAILDQIRRSTREEMKLGTDAFSSSAAEVLGGLSGAGSVLPEYMRLQRDISQAGADSENRTLFDLWNTGQQQRTQAAGLYPTIEQLPFGRLTSGMSFAQIPRQIKDLRVQRALGAFTDRVNRYINSTLGASGQITGALAPAYGDMTAAAQGPSAGAYILQGLGGALSTAGALGIMGGGLGGGGGGGGGGAAAPISFGGGSFLGGGGGYLGGQQYGGANSFLYPTTNPYQIAGNSLFGSNQYQSPFGGQATPIFGR